MANENVKAMLGYFVLLLYISKVESSMTCRRYDGETYFCGEDQFCCKDKEHCCTRTFTDDPYYGDYSYSVWRMWYFWFIIIIILMTCFAGCGYWRRRLNRQVMMRRDQNSVTTGGTGYVPQHHRSQSAPAYPMVSNYTCVPGMAIMTPPSYEEVISKPESYPVNKSDLPPYSAPVISTETQGLEVIGDGNTATLPPYSTLPSTTQPPELNTSRSDAIDTNPSAVSVADNNTDTSDAQSRDSSNNTNNTQQHHG